MNFVPILLLLTSMISIQIGATFAKGLFPIIGAEGATLLRQGFAAIILCLVWRPWKQKLNKKQLQSVFIYGLSLSGMNLLFYMALGRIPLGIAVAIEFVGPLSVALLSSKKNLDFLWAAMAAIGIILILPLTKISQPVDPLGILYALGAGICWAMYIVFGKKAGSSVHSGTVAALGMVVAAMFTVPFGIISAGPLLFDKKILPTAVAVAVLSGALPYSLEMFALKKLPTNTFGILMSLEPVFAALSGLVFLSEHLSVIQWSAITCIIAASLGSTVFSKKQLMPN